MKLWKISQEVNTDYDTFDSAIVAAETEEAARNTHPSEYVPENWPTGPFDTLGYDTLSSWAIPAKVKVKYIGEAAPDIPAGVVLSSFNAG